MTDAKGIVPDKSDQAVCGEEERSLSTTRAALHPEFRQGGLILKPGESLVGSGGGTTALEIIQVQAGGRDRCQQGEKYEFFGHDLIILV